MNIYQLIRGHEALPEMPFAMIVLSVEIIILNFFVGNIVVEKVLFCCGLTPEILLREAGNVDCGCIADISRVCPSVLLAPSYTPADVGKVRPIWK